MQRFTLAHLTDPHLTLAGLPPSWRDLPLKRALGRISWQANRRRLHRPEALLAVIADLLTARPDHVAVSGDLTNLGLAAEFDRAVAWLARLGEPGAVSVVPGNHDAMVRSRWADGIGRWSAFMSDDLTGRAAAEADFPYLRRRGPVALIGLSSAAPSRVFHATGQVGRRQADRLATLLDATRRAGLCRIVLLHHPPIDGMAPERKALLDRGRIQAALGAHGAELVLCGHTHIAALGELAGPHGPIAVTVGPSASALPSGERDPRRAAGWQRIDVAPAASGWRLRIERRQLGTDGAMRATFASSFEAPGCSGSHT